MSSPVMSSPARLLAGICGWFGNVGGGEPGQILFAMAPMAADGSRRISSVAHRDRAILLSPDALGAGLVEHDGVIAAIDGYPQWTRPEDAALARQRGHAVALATAFRDHGTSLLHRIRGPFVFAVYDQRQRKGMAAVDRLGIQSLCYARKNDGVVFGSSTDLVARHPALSSTVSAQALYDYMLLYRIPAPLTIYEEQKKLLPAQCLIWDDGKAHVETYWQIPYQADREANTRFLRDGLMSGMRRGVSRVIEGEDTDRVGAFLSGGLDSSTVCGLLREGAGRPARAFTIGFDVEGFDETEYAKAAARHFDLQHTVYRMTPDDVVDLIPRIGDAFDEPFGNSSVVPTHFCAKIARDHGVDLMLAGDGGDELFGGNAWYTRMKLYEYYHVLPQALRRGVIEPLVFGAPGGDRFSLTRKARNYIASANTPMPDRGFESEAGRIADPRDILAPDLLEDIDFHHPHDTLREVYRRTISPDMLHRMLHQDMQVVLADNDLRKVNRMCALADVRVRFPLLDEELVDFSARIPPEIMLPGLKLRHFFREAVRDFLPRKVVEKRKHGFGLPFTPWLKKSINLQDITHAALTAARRRGLVRAEYVDTLLTNVSSTTQSAFAGPSWDLMMLELWLQRHADHGAGRTGPAT